MSAPAAPPAPPVERRHFPRRWHRARRALYGLIGLIGLGAVAYVGLRSVEPPRLDLVMPTQARVGEVVILAGAGFRSPGVACPDSLFPVAWQPPRTKAARAARADNLRVT